jgi:hypothetical protein
MRVGKFPYIIKQTNRQGKKHKREKNLPDKERFCNRKTDQKKNWETERHRERGETETERRRDKETERQRDRYKQTKKQAKV